MATPQAAVKIFLLAALLVFFPRAGTAHQPRPFKVEYDFEDGRAPEIVPHISTGNFTVNFMGITDEKAFSGRNSFKFDVTFESGHYFTWLIPVEAGLDGKMELSMRYSVETTGGASFGPGVSLVYPATPSANGVDFFTWASSTDGGWRWLRRDLSYFARNRIVRHRHAMSAHEIRHEQVLASMRGLIICLRGMQPGERVILRIDDLSVKGEASGATEEFDRRAVALWEPVGEKHSMLAGKIRDAVSDGRNFLSSTETRSPVESFLRDEALEELDKLAGIADDASGRGYFRSMEAEEAKRRESRVYGLIANMTMLRGYNFRQGF